MKIKLFALAVSLLLIISFLLLGKANEVFAASGACYTCEGTWVSGPYFWFESTKMTFKYNPPTKDCSKFGSAWKCVPYDIATGWKCDNDQVKDPKGPSCGANEVCDEANLCSPKPGVIPAAPTGAAPTGAALDAGKSVPEAGSSQQAAGQALNTQQLSIPGTNLDLGQLDPLKGKFTTIGSIITQLLNFVFPLAGLILFIMLIIGGFELLTSTGNPEAIKKAQGRITSALIGFVIIFVAYWLVQILQSIFGLSPIFDMTSKYGTRPGI